MITHLTIALLWFGASSLWFYILWERFGALKPPEPPSNPFGDHPHVTVIIPARNEAVNIEACLRGLLRQHYPRQLLDTLVVNDSSEDETAEIASRLAQDHAELQLLQAPPLPEGWRGKQHACWTGAQAAEGEWLCFLDADTRHSPELLLTVIADVQSNQVDLLSLHPEQEMRGFWERLLMPVPFMTLMLLLDARRINDPDSPAALANGQFILIRREVYFAVDGHRRIRSALLEDVELGKLVKSSGWNIALRSGKGLIRTRMYRDLPTLWNALARNGSELFGPVLTAFAVLNAFFAAVFPLAFPIWLVSNFESRASLLPFAVLCTAVLGSINWYAAHMKAFQELNIPLRYLFLLPISDVLIGFVNLDGLIQRFTGRRTWKGRTL